MMECDHDILKNIREYYISQIVPKRLQLPIYLQIIFQILNLCTAMNMVPLVAMWIKICNETHTHSN